MMPSKRPVIIDLTTPSPPSKRRKHSTEQQKYEEKRLRRWRDHAPASFLTIQHRALSQRMIVLDRQRTHQTEPSPHTTETVSLAGTTGNVYTVTIARLPSCNCPHALKGNQCKHLIYVLARVLRAPEHLQWQLAFLTHELNDIMAAAPPLPSAIAEEQSESPNQKPVEGECPICCEDFDAKSAEEVVYCKASCGNNIHRSCFNQWAATKRRLGDVTCPFCRASWQGTKEDPLATVLQKGEVNEDGYVNLAGELGLSRSRDYSSYSRWWTSGAGHYWD